MIIPDLPDLPVKQCLPQLKQALLTGHAILSTSTGSGKTTLVPLSLMNESWLGDKKILMLEPRRPAARMAAARMATLCHQSVGKTVGYQVRFDRQIGTSTRIEVITEGLLIRRLQNDPELSSVGLIIFDEFHERNLVSDLSLALAMDACQLREDLRLLVMSASINSDALAGLIKAQVIQQDIALFPVQQHFAEQTLPLRDSVDVCVPLIRQALLEVSEDVLVFLPGKKEIQQLEKLAGELWGGQCEVLTLYGDQSAAEQDRVLNPVSRAQRRLILATDIAETSLTIEGLQAVVDSGRARRPVFQASSGLTRLQTQWISQASALQRSGRAGRLGPGHCYRAWTESQQQRMPAQITAEILQADLTDLVLELAVWGVTHPDALLWLDKPPLAHWQQASDLLKQLQALDESGQVTQSGRQMATLPLHPRLAHMLLKAYGNGDQQLAADLAALLSERELFTRAAGRNLPLDLNLRLSVLQDWRNGISVRQVSQRRLQQVDRLARQFLKSLEKPTVVSGSRGYSAGYYLALAYPDRLARRRKTSAGFLLSSGRGVSLPADDSLAGEDYLVIADLDAGQREGRAWLAAAISLQEIEGIFADAICVKRQCKWDKQAQKVIALEQRTLGALLLAQRHQALQKTDAAEDILLQQISQQGLGFIGIDDNFRQYLARLQWMFQLYPGQGWPEATDQALLASLQDWLLPWIEGMSTLRQLKSLNWIEVLQAWVGWEKQKILDEQLPVSFQTPAGTRRKIIYEIGQAPHLAVPLQEMLGEAESPQLAGGKVKLLLHLLSPAGRALQITNDLSAFWQGAYTQVKKEMRGRYPKHYWPDDPASAQATRFTKKRL